MVKIPSRQTVQVTTQLLKKLKTTQIMPGPGNSRGILFLPFLQECEQTTNAP